MCTRFRPLTRRIGSEHGPQWSEADIEVEEVLKGTAGRTITIVFAASRDVMRYQIPKPRVGQSGV
ncbi:MAG: hypothetical protein DME09_02215 [Candidatus Rokuibacteriota bacterium]|nr:MAG: hypothetical protein DME09_02215 [Candidatus Rokubacteria bacterium]